MSSTSHAAAFTEFSWFRIGAISVGASGMSAWVVVASYVSAPVHVVAIVRGALMFVALYALANVERDAHHVLFYNRADLP